MSTNEPSQRFLDVFGPELPLFYAASIVFAVKSTESGMYSGVSADFVPIAAVSQLHPVALCLVDLQAIHQSHHGFCLAVQAPVGLFRQ